MSTRLSAEGLLFSVNPCNVCGTVRVPIPTMTKEVRRRSCLRPEKTPGSYPTERFEFFILASVFSCSPSCPPEDWDNVLVWLTRGILNVNMKVLSHFARLGKFFRNFVHFCPQHEVEYPKRHGSANKNSDVHDRLPFHFYQNVTF